MLKKTMWILLCLALGLATAACGGTTEAMEDAPLAAGTGASEAGGEDDGESGDADALRAPAHGGALEEIHEEYVAPLGLTSVIGRSWSTPAELDADSVLVTLEILALGEPELFDTYAGEDGDLYFPQAYAEEYAAQVFGMTSGQLRAARCYDAATEAYIVLVGLGGAWDVETTGYEQTDTGLEVYYTLVDGWDYPSAHGVLRIEERADGGHRYLSNTVVEEIYTLLRFPMALGFELEEGKATMNSGGEGAVGVDGDTRIPYDGRDLANVIAFYTDALDRAGAVGEAEAGKYEDGWAWQGSYDGGKPLTIDIQPRAGEDDYRITILF